ncbi:MAG: HNH endonuclease [Phycisphaerales bacterium]|nr:HNH endonuclease [Phycisphaerales bacterium]
MDPNRALAATGHCGAPIHWVDDLTGSRFGRLAVLALTGRNAKRDALWLCACDCGGSHVVPSQALKSGGTSSCGCLKVQNRPEVLLGRRFGRLLVAGAAPSSRGGPRWACVCDCGREKVAAADTLRAGHVISCGCAKRDQPGLMPAAARAERAAVSHARRARRRGTGGTFTAAEVEAVRRKQRGCCASCAASLASGFHRDHRVPLALGGPNTIDNIDLLCPPCNLRKGAKDPAVWAAENGRLL